MLQLFSYECTKLLLQIICNALLILQMLKEILILVIIVLRSKKISNYLNEQAIIFQADIYYNALYV